MPEPSDTTKYDVAISFLSADVDTAKTVAEKLSPMQVFFFPRNQEDVAGTDGMEKFRAAFRYESRIQVVLYRKGWGETPWTGVEETAITERCLAEGWRGLFFVALAPDPKPNWVPDTKVYLDLSLYSMDELIGAIKLRAQELGAELRRQTPAEKARKALQRAEFEKETQELFRRETGVALVREQAGVVCDVLESEFKAAADEKIAPRIVRPVPVNIAFTTDRVGLIMGLRRRAPAFRVIL